MAVPFWVMNLSQARLNALEARWQSVLTQMQLANPWQQIRLDGTALPGLWMLRKVKRKIVAQQNKKSGADGGSATFRGLENPNFEAKGELYIPSHLSAWVSLVQQLDVTGNPSARTKHLIEHPLCTLTGVRAVLCLGFEYDLPEAGGPLRVTLEMLGVDQRDGATVAPKPKATPVGVAPTIPLNPGTGQTPKLPIIQDPVPAR